LRPHATDVMARNTRPAGAVRGVALRSVWTVME
jgi:hypothetical protein